MFVGGVGSGCGNRACANRLVEICQSIDIRRWRRERLLTPGHEFGYYRSSPGSFCTIRVRCERDRVALSYGIAGQWPGGSAKERFVALVTMPGVFGGVRH